MEEQPPRSAEELRRWVRARSPQPFDDAAVVPRASDTDWIYGPDQYPLALLARLVDDGFAANRHVHYPRNHGRVARRVGFRAVATGAGTVRVRVAGRADVAGDAITARPVEGGLDLVLPGAGAVVELAVTAARGAAPTLGVPSGAMLTGWTASADDGPWLAVRPRSGGGRPPHLDPTGTVEVVAMPGPEGVLDVGAPVLGRPILPPGPQPVVTSGESVAEALADEASLETRHEVVPLPDGGWTTRHPLGFRYLRVVSDAAPAAVAIAAQIAPATRGGAFACSDERLTRIWATAQYTLRSCSQGLMIDGIKRDRMPWAGDQALSTLANAFALGDAQVVADGLVALGRPDHGYVNGIADYSLWWVVNADLSVRYLGGAFAEREAAQVDAFVADLARHADDAGVFRPAAQRGGFVDSGPGSVFLDWGLALEHGRDPVALQMLWSWALRSAERLLERAGHPGAARWRRLADVLESTLRSRGWVADGGRWADYLDAGAGAAPAPYANFLAVLAGLHPDGVPAGVAASIRDGSAGTPFMTAFRLRALVAAGEHDAVLDEVRRIWGAMLDAGPGTFWEEGPTGGDDLAMYGRPFGRSRCHAWSAGPAAILPEAVLGVRPLADGWARFAVEPRLGGLEWAAVVIPAPTGDLVVRADAEGVSVLVPAGAELVRGDRVEPGPALIEWPTADGRGPAAATAGGGAAHGAS